MAQAMLRLLATPNTTTFFPCMVSIDGANLASETCQDNTFTTDGSDLTDSVDQFKSARSVKSVGRCRPSIGWVDHGRSVAFDQDRCSTVFAVALDPVAEVHLPDRHRLSAVRAEGML